MHFSSDLYSPQRSSNVNELGADERYFCEIDENSHKSRPEKNCTDQRVLKNSHFYILQNTKLTHCMCFFYLRST